MKIERRRWEDGIKRINSIRRRRRKRIDTSNQPLTFPLLDSAHSLHLRDRDEEVQSITKTRKKKMGRSEKENKELKEDTDKS